MVYELNGFDIVISAFSFFLLQLLITKSLDSDKFLLTCISSYCLTEYYMPLNYLCAYLLYGDKLYG